MFKIFSSKTIWAAIITGAVGIGCFLTGQADVVDLVKIESIAALAAFLRTGIAKAEI
ncbi:hypothetical protein KKH18_01320 [bacterium]|nr:hypothetical protein [bacterium]